MICQNVPAPVYTPPLWQRPQSYKAGDEVFWNGVYTGGPPAANCRVISRRLSSLWVQDSYPAQLAANLRELRLTFLWPLLPNGSPGNGRQTFRTSVAGQLRAHQRSLRTTLSECVVFFPAANVHQRAMNKSVESPESRVQSLLKGACGRFAARPSRPSTLDSCGFHPGRDAGDAGLAVAHRAGADDGLQQHPEGLSRQPHPDRHPRIRPPGHGPDHQRSGSHDAVVDSGQHQLSNFVIPHVHKLRFIRCAGKPLHGSVAVDSIVDRQQPVSGPTCWKAFSA